LFLLVYFFKPRLFSAPELLSRQHLAERPAALLIDCCDISSAPLFSLRLSKSAVLTGESGPIL
jgi:hypothetical protein